MVMSASVDTGQIMRIRTPKDLGAVIRDRRRQLELDQAALAKRIGVSRYWVIMIERGHPRAELGLVLRALAALEIELDANLPKGKRPTGGVDINAIVAKARKAAS
jgi:HTH-type transcriptional regulator / antitoxin HipB